MWLGQHHSSGIGSIDSQQRLQRIRSFAGAGEVLDERDLVLARTLSPPAVPAPAPLEETAPADRVSPPTNGNENVCTANTANGEVQQNKRRRREQRSTHVARQRLAAGWTGACMGPQHFTTQAPGATAGVPADPGIAPHLHQPKPKYLGRLVSQVSAELNVNRSASFDVARAASDPRIGLSMSRWPRWRTVQETASGHRRFRPLPMSRSARLQLQREAHGGQS